MAHEMEAEAGPLPLGPDRRIRQPDLGHEIPASELGEDPSVDPVGLGRERGDALDLGRVPDGDVPARQFELVVDEAGSRHRLDGRTHPLAVPLDMRTRAF